ncbi:MAG: hypothetical protein ACLFVK_03110 [Dehalococcoidia bacterium]
MVDFTLMYLLLIFGGALGVFQIAAAHGRLRGLYLFKNTVITYLVGFLLLGVTYGWFFSQTNLDMPHAEVEGAQQLGYFLLGSLLALLATFLFSSLNPRSGESGKASTLGEGLEDLKGRPVFQAFIQRLSNKAKKG